MASETDIRIARAVALKASAEMLTGTSANVETVLEWSADFARWLLDTAHEREAPPAIAPPVGSMKLTVGAYTKTEGVVPYTLFGDFNNNFTGGLVLFEGGHTLRLEVFDDGGAGIGDFLVPFTVGEEPVLVIAPAVQMVLDAMQEQIDTINEKLNTPVTVWRA